MAAGTSRSHGITLEELAREGVARAELIVRGINIWLLSIKATHDNCKYRDIDGGEYVCKSMLYGFLISSSNVELTQWHIYIDHIDVVEG